MLNILQIKRYFIGNHVRLFLYVDQFLFLIQTYGVLIYVN